MSPITVTRVYWYTDWLRGVRAALRELWRSFFGCHHDWHTIRFQHVGPAIDNATGLRFNRESGTWAVNECSKCGQVHTFGTWSASNTEKRPS